MKRRESGERRDDRRLKPPEAARPRTVPGDQVVFGVEPIRELLAAAPESVRVLYMTERDGRRFAAEAAKVRAAGGRVVSVDPGTLSQMAGSAARHQGLVATVREYNYASVEQVLEAAPDPLLVVDGVTDPRNLGAILRSAEGAGVGALVLARDRTVGVTPAAIKASAGAWIHLRIARCGNVVRTLEMLKERGYWIIALVPGAEMSLYELDTSRRLALVIGAEDIGLRELVKKRADFHVGIPMRGKVSSLNVAVATAVALFEVARRRGQTAGPGLAPKAQGH